MDLYSLLTSIATVLGVLVALMAIIIQMRQNRIALGVTLIRDMEKQFDDTEFKRIRLEVAMRLYFRKEAEPLPLSGEIIMDFFDGMGIYQCKGAIDKEITWVMFYYWLGHYWQLLKKQADTFEAQHSGVEYYKNFRLLYHDMTIFGRKKRKMPPENEYFTKERLENFLKDEIANLSLSVDSCSEIQEKASK